MTETGTTAASVRQDLLAEQAELDEIVAGLEPEQWEHVTPSPGWTVRDQVGHLAYFDQMAALAITDPEAFEAHRAELIATLNSPTSADDFTLSEARALSPAELLDHWRQARRLLADASAGLADDTRIDWYGPSMGSKSFLTARLMEAWAHGQDIADTVGAPHPPTDRLRHIAQLGFITRKWTYVNRGLEMPTGDVQLILTAPSGATWTWGPDGAESTVTGAAVDFCLVTSQRRNLDDTDLMVTGTQGRDWLEKAQLFAGPPSDPPPPRR